MKQSQLPTCCGVSVVSGFFNRFFPNRADHLREAEKRASGPRSNRTLGIATTIPSQEMDDILTEEGWISVLSFINRNSKRPVTLWVKALQGDEITFFDNTPAKGQLE